MFTFKLLMNFTIIIQLVIFAISVILIRKNHCPGFYLLLAISTIFVFGKSDNLFQHTGFVLDHPNLFLIGAWSFQLLGPVIYLYVRQRLEPDFYFTAKMALHGLWVLPSILYFYSNWWGLDSLAKIEKYSGGGFENLTSQIIYPVFADCVLIFYLGMAAFKLKTQGVQLQQWFSTIEDKILSAIRTLITTFLGISLIHVTWLVLSYFYPNEHISMGLIIIQLSFQLILINGLYIEFMTHSTPDTFDNLGELSAPDKRQKNKTKLSASETKSLTKKLDKVLRDQDLHLNPNLSIVDLAKPLKVHAKTLSELINVHYQCNFFELINRQRIDFAKQQIKQNPTKNLLQIAFDSGFNTKSTFNSAFKRYTNLTPSAYKKSIK